MASPPAPRRVRTFVVLALLLTVLALPVLRWTTQDTAPQVPSEPEEAAEPEPSLPEHLARPGGPHGDRPNDRGSSTERAPVPNPVRGSGASRSGPTLEELEEGIVDDLLVGSFASHVVRVVDPDGHAVIGARVTLDGVDTPFFTDVLGSVAVPRSSGWSVPAFEVDLGPLGRMRVAKESDSLVTVVRTPDLARLHVDWVDARGSPARGGVELSSTPFGDRLPPEPSLELELRPGGKNPPLTVVPGSQLVLHGRRRFPAKDGPQVPAVWRAVNAPGEVGAVERVELPVDGDRPLLTATLTHADGTPLSGVPVEVLLDSNGVPGARLRLITGPMGELDLVAVPEFPWVDASHVTFRVEAADGAPSSARVALEFEGPVLALGELRLVPDTLRDLPWLVRGRVLRSDRTPLDRARIEVEVRVGEAWQTLPHVQGLTDGDGCFALRAVVPAAPLRVVATHVDHAVEARVFHGGEEVELRAWAFGRVELTLADDTLGIPTEQLFFHALHVSGPEPGVRFAQLRHRGGHVHPDGSCRLERLPPGTFRLELSLNRFGPPLGSLEGLRVPEGGTCADPRLDGLRVALLIPSWTVVLVSPDGEPEPRGTVSVLSPDPGVPRWGWTLPLEGPVLSVPQVPGGVRLDVHVPGLVARDHDPLEGDAELVLVRLREVCVRFPGDAFSGLAGFEMKGILRQAGDDTRVHGHMPESATASLGEDLVFRDVPPGTYDLWSWVGRPGDEGMDHGFVHRGLTVPDGTGEVRVEVGLNGENAERLRQLRGD